MGLLEVEGRLQGSIWASTPPLQLANMAMAVFRSAAKALTTLSGLVGFVYPF